MTDIRLEQGLAGSGVPIGVPELPKDFFEAVRRRFYPDGDGRMLALWRGAGSFLTFAGDFESILIVDPEPGRLAESMWEAERLGIKNAIFLEGGREVLHPRMGRFRLLIVQDAFLRKDRKRRISYLAKMAGREVGSSSPMFSGSVLPLIGRRPPWMSSGIGLVQNGPRVIQPVSRRGMSHPFLSGIRKPTVITGRGSGPSVKQ